MVKAMLKFSTAAIMTLELKYIILAEWGRFSIKNEKLIFKNSDISKLRIDWATKISLNGINLEYTDNNLIKNIW